MTFGILRFFQKRNERTVIKKNLFIRFLEESESFQNYLTFKKLLKSVSSHKLKSKTLGSNKFIKKKDISQIASRCLLRQACNQKIMTE